MLENKIRELREEFKIKKTENIMNLALFPSGPSLHP